MHKTADAACRNRTVRRYSVSGFTLIELLTVIAIIAILTAILFPLAGTVREQARSSDCMTKLHQLWVSANVYKSDEGGFPPALLSYAEGETVIAGQTVRVPYDPTSGQTLIPADQTINGFLYREQIKNIENFRCPDSNVRTKATAVKAYYPVISNFTQPDQAYFWPQGYQTIGAYLAAQGCQTTTFPSGPGTFVEDCFYEIPASDPLLGNLHLKPRYFYNMDAYDIGPAFDTNGEALKDAAGNTVYLRHYATDWTSPDGTGATDLPNQLKYQNPPDDKTLLTYCTWHQAVAKTSSVPAISMGGSAKKLSFRQILSKGANVFR